MIKIGIVMAKTMIAIRWDSCNPKANSFTDSILRKEIANRPTAYRARYSANSIPAGRILSLSFQISTSANKFQIISYAITGCTAIPDMSSPFKSSP